MMRFLRYVMAIAFAMVANLSLMATETLKELTFPDDNKANNQVDNYTSTWKAMKGEAVWTLTGFNNNKWNDGWNYVKCQVSKDNVATIVSPDLNTNIGYVVLTVDNTDANSNVSVKMQLTYADGSTNDVTTRLVLGKISIPTYQKKVVSSLDFTFTSTSSEKSEVQISKIQIFGVGDAPDEAYAQVNGLEELFKKYSAKANLLEINFTNAKVVYVSGKNNDNVAYVREGDYAVALESIDKTQLKVNSVINGKIKFATFYGAAQFPNLNAKGISYENITPSDEPAEPREVTIATLEAGKYKNDLVMVKDFTYKKGSPYKAIDGDNKTMLLVDKYSVGGLKDLTNGEKYTAVGIFGNISSTEATEGCPILWVTKPVKETSTTGISNITMNEATTDAPVYNLAGQKVGKDYKGVVIKAGKKMIQK